MARPEKPTKINEDQIYELACEGLTYESIARIAGVDRSTLIRRFAPLIKRGHAQLGEQLRMRLVRMAIDNNDKSALIYLDKRMNKDDEDNTTSTVPVAQINLKPLE